MQLPTRHKARNHLRSASFELQKIHSSPSTGCCSTTCLMALPTSPVPPVTRTFILSLQSYFDHNVYVQFWQTRSRFYSMLALSEFADAHNEKIGKLSEGFNFMWRMGALSHAHQNDMLLSLERHSIVPHNHFVELKYSGSNFRSCSSALLEGHQHTHIDSDNSAFCLSSYGEVSRLLALSRRSSTRKSKACRYWIN